MGQNCLLNSPGKDLGINIRKAESCGDIVLCGVAVHFPVQIHTDLILTGRIYTALLIGMYPCLCDILLLCSLLYPLCNVSDKRLLHEIGYTYRGIESALYQSAKPHDAQ